MVNAALALALLAASASRSYDCTLDPPRVLSGAPGQERSDPIQLPDVGPWRFRINATDQRDRTIQTEILWEGDPIQIAGRFPALTIAPGALAFTAFSAGPCLFTETACMTLITLVDESAQRAHVIVTPSALTRDENGSRRPFTILLSGTCVRTEGSR
jgi:hypothetical protein